MGKSVGIDIGHQNIKLIELENKRGQLEVIKAGFEPIVKGDVSASLKDLLELTKPSLKRVNISMSGPSVVVRYLEMPHMDKSQLKSAIVFEAEKYIPFNISEAVLDCAIIDKTSSGADRVLLVAAKKSDVGNILGIVKGFHIEVNVVDIDSFAFLNSFERTKVWAEHKETYSLLNLGAKYSNLNIITEQNVYFTRDILFGGLDITNRISQVLGISIEDAEVLKYNPLDKKDDITNAIMPIFRKFTSEIRLSFDYFESKFGKAVEGLYISGGTAYLFNIVNILGDNLGIQVNMWNPFENILLNDGIKDIKDFPSLFSVSLGLALRG